MMCRRRFLKVIWLYRIPKVTKDDKDGEKAYLFIERGAIVYLQFSIGRGKYATVEVFQYTVLGMYTTIYNN